MYKIKIYYLYPDAGKADKLVIYTEKTLAEIEENLIKIADKRLEQKEGLTKFTTRHVKILKVEKLDAVIF